MLFPFARRSGRVREEALVWLARLKRGLREREGPEFLLWLKRRSHRLAIAKSAVEWHGPEVLAVLSEIFPIPAAVVEPRRRPHPIFLAAGALAGACLTVLIPTGIVLWTGAHSHAYAAAAEAPQRLALEDGTRVTLNRGARINVIYAVHATSVSISRGEALFKVSSKSDHPFYVHAVGQDLETSSATFDVRLAPPNALNITVLDGTIRVLASPLARCDGHLSNSRVLQQIRLEPRQMLVVESDGQLCEPLTEQALHGRIAWQSSS